MLSKKDKEWIKQTVSEIVVKCLTIEVTYEKKEDEKTGQPLATPELKTEEVFMPLWWADYLPKYIGAIRGMQETLDKHDGQILKLSALVDGNNKISEESFLKIDTIGKLILQTEKSLKMLAQMSDHLRQLGFEDTKKIDYIEGEVDDESNN